MSKNRKGIVITLKSSHLNLNESFNAHLEEEMKCDNTYYSSDRDFYEEFYKTFGFNPDYYDEDYYDDYYDEYYAPRYRKGKKRHKSSYNYDYNSKKETETKKSPARKSLISDDLVINTLNSDYWYDLDNKKIYYYNDYTDPNDKKEFESIFDFDKFLDEEGISVPEVEVSNLLSRTESYCCINPKERLENGNLVLITSRSYGDLRYDCAESEDELTSAYAV